MHGLKAADGCSSANLNFRVTPRSRRQIQAAPDHVREWNKRQIEAQAAESTPMRGKLSTFARILIEVGRWRLAWTLGLVVLLPLTEGLGVVLLLPTFEATGMKLDD